jgi:hypothetical protein
MVTGALMEQRVQHLFLSVFIQAGKSARRTCVQKQKAPMQALFSGTW